MTKKNGIEQDGFSNRPDEVTATFRDLLAVLATSKERTFRIFCELIAQASLAMSSEQFAQVAFHLDPEYISGERIAEPKSDNPEVAVLFKIRQTIFHLVDHVTNTGIYPPDVTTDQIKAFQRFEDPMKEILQLKYLVFAGRNQSTDWAGFHRLAMVSMEELAQIATWAQALQEAKDKIVYASDIIFSEGDDVLHKDERDSEHPLTEVERRDITEHIVAKYSNPLRNLQPQPVAWSAAYGANVPKDGIRVSLPLIIRTRLRQIPEHLVRKNINLRANTGLNLLEILNRYPEYCEGLTVEVQGTSEQFPLPMSAALRLLVDKLPLNAQMLNQLFNKKPSETIHTGDTDAAFPIFHRVALSLPEILQGNVEYQHAV